jgi:hypothetical protein
MAFGNQQSSNERSILLTIYSYRGQTPRMVTQKQPATSQDIGAVVKHLRTLTAELTAVHDELYWLAMQAQDAVSKETPAQLNVKLLAELKAAVDNMRLLLWNYIEAASALDPRQVQEGMESERLRRATEFLQLLRPRQSRNA